MDVTVTVLDGRGGDDLRDLGAWLSDQEELRGRVSVVGRPAPSGSLGGLADTLVASLAPGGVAGAFATALVAWIRYRTGNFRTVVRRADGSQVELTAERVRGLDAQALRTAVGELTRTLEGGTGVVDGDSGRSARD
jgi:hypothetical protein